MTLYHVRNAIPLEDLARGRKVAAGQEARIENLFRANPETAFTPIQISERLGILLTSARRAITNLTTKGVLVKDPVNCRKERYGMFNCTWKLKGADNNTGVQSALEL